MKRYAKAFALLMSGLAGMTASAAFFQQKDKSSDSDTDIYEPTQWDQNRAPGDGDSIQFPGYAYDKRFHLTQSRTNAFTTLYFKSGHSAAAQDGSNLRFDTKGHELLLPSSATAYKADFLWQTYVPSGKDVPSADYTLAEFTRTASSTRSAVLLRDFAFRQTSVADYSTEIDFERGEFNAFDPESSGGEADGGGVYTFKIGLDSTIPTRFVFSPGTVFKVPRFEIERGASVSTVFNGAKVSADGSFTQRGNTVVSNGAEIAVGHLGGTGAGAFNHNAGSFLIRDVGTSLEVKGNYTSHGGAFTNDGACVSIKGNMNNHARYVQKSGETSLGDSYYTSSGDSILHVLGGKLTIAGSYGILTSMGSVKVDGGILGVDRIRNNGSSGVFSVIQTGGEIKVGGNTRPGVWACETGNETFRMELRGGILSTPLVRGLKPGAVLLGDGGRLLAAANAPADTTDNVAFLSGFDKVSIGSNGLVLDTMDYDVSVAQDIGNADGENGVLVKTGAGALSYSGRLSVSSVVVDEGVFKAVDVNAQLDSAVSVSGATLSLAGPCTTLSVSALSMTNAVVALDPGDVIAVDGGFALENVSLSWSSMPSDPQSVFVVSGELSAAVRDELSKITLSGAQSGVHAETEFVYDANAGKTTVKVSVVPDAPLSGRAVWKGTGTVWQVPENWEGNSVPTAKDTAVFGTGGGSTVIIRDGDTAGALSFECGEHVLDGAESSLRLHGVPGGARIDVVGGEHEIACGLDLLANIPVSVSANASLRISGTVKDGGIDKSGKGCLTIAGPLATRQGVTLRDGILAVDGVKALGTALRDRVTLKGGTLEIADGVNAVVPGTASISADGAQKSVVVKAEGNVSFSEFAAAEGFLVKRGKGVMTVNVPAETTVAISASASPVGQGDHHNADAGINFPADGSEPTGMRGPLSIVEGELRLVGQGANACVKSPGTTYVSVPTPSAVVAQPMLTLDNVTLDCGSLYNGWCLGRPAFSTRLSTIRVLNGSVLNWTDSMPGYACTVDGFFATYAATNSMLRYVKDNAYLTRGRIDGEGTVPIVRYFLNSSSFEVGSAMVLDGSVLIDLDNGSRFGRPDGRTTSLAYGTPARVYGEIFTRNGSCLALSAISEQEGQTRDLTLAFDGGEWQWSDDYGDRTLSASSTGHVRWEMRGKGVVLKPVAGRTLTINAPFEGPGGIVVDGPGTVAFGANAYAFGGAADVRQGMLDLSSAGELTGASFSGDGVVKGGTLKEASVCVALSDAWVNTNGVPVFSDCAFFGKVTVNPGRNDGNLLVLPAQLNPTPVAKIAGTTNPNLRLWRIDRRSVQEARGVFTLVGDTIYLTPAPVPGLMVVVR